jgi:hypothetical protein
MIRLNYSEIIGKMLGERGNPITFGFGKGSSLDPARTSL